MAKVIMTIAADDGMEFEDIMSFKTDNHIGIWDGNNAQFVLLDKDSSYFEPRSLGIPDNLKELDDITHEECGEHILEVFDRADYHFTLEVN